MGTNVTRLAGFLLFPLVLGVSPAAAAEPDLRLVNAAAAQDTQAVRAPDLFEPSFAAAAIPIELVPKRVLQVVVLVIVFSCVERARSRDLRHDRIREPS